MRLLSQRDERTQPGVLTPGYEKKKASRRRGGRSFLPNDGSIYATTDKYLPPLSSFVPFSRTTADRQGGRSSDRYPGLKPQAESYCPFGTEIKSRQYAKTSILQYSVWLESRTACPTKPKLYGADRSSRPRKRGALQKKDVGEVGRTTTRTSTKVLVRT